MAGRKLVNRIALYRQQVGGMTQDGLAIRVGTSQQQISRIEKGQKITPSMAQAIANALGKPIGLVFPDLGAEASAENEPALSYIERFWKAGFELENTTPINNEVKLRLRGFSEEFRYIISHDDTVRLENQLSGEEDDLRPRTRPLFFAMQAQGRYIVVNLDEVIWVNFYDWSQAVALEESFDDLRVFMRGEPDPYVLPYSDLPDPGDGEYDFWHDWMFFEERLAPLPRFVRIHDIGEQEERFINVNEIVLVECPSKALIEEISRQYRFEVEGL